jgi:uncharacterized protein YjaZ
LTNPSSASRCLCFHSSLIDNLLSETLAWHAAESLHARTHAARWAFR